MADKDKEKAKVDLGLLEEDDEFEEFPAEGKITEIITKTSDDDKQKIKIKLQNGKQKARMKRKN